MENATKKCTKCKEFFTLSFFHKHSGRKDGLAAWCKSCVKENTKKNYERVPREVRLKKKREYNRKNRNRVNQYNELIRKKYPERHCAKQNLRNARKIRATPKWLSKEHESCMRDIYLSAKILGEKFNQEYHVDHVIPLRGKDICGLHVPWNLQLLQKNLNLSKSNRIKYVELR